MKKLTLRPNGWHYSVLQAILIFSFPQAKAQFRNYNIVYTKNAKGSTAMFGNTLMRIEKSNGSVDLDKMNSNSANGTGPYGNDNENMQYEDIDGNSGTGSTTRNSSSSDLILPSGTNTIKLARLYWGGRVLKSQFNLSNIVNQKIKIRKGTSGAYLDFTALQIDKTVMNSGTSSEYSQYQAYTDVTSFIQTNGAGTYTVGNAPLSTGSISGGGYYGGWCIVIAYENPTLPFNSIRIYDGYQEVYDSGDPLVTTVTLNGLDVPSGALTTSDAKMGVLTWEGDANLTGDFLKINGNTFSNGLNQATNPWNGTISNNGVHVTTKNPNYTCQMAVDIDQFDVGTGYGILPNASNVTLQFGTSSDLYLPGVFTFVIKMKDPNISLDKFVADASGNGYAAAGEVLTYTLNGKNIGAGNANKVVVVDTLPSTVTYLPGSLKVNACPGVTAGTKTDAAGDDVAEVITSGSKKIVRFRLGTGATATDSGRLTLNQSFEVQFKVTVNNPGINVSIPSIVNTARMYAKSDANVTFMDDGTAIINPQPGGGPLAVTLNYFKASLIQNNATLVTWGTVAEINCSSYEVERSTDGQSFSTIANQSCNGTSYKEHSYSFTDDVSLINAAVIYYRLKQKDADGKSTYSDVVSVKLSKQDNVISISPNPFVNYTNINFSWSKTEIIKLSIINSVGKTFITKNIQANKGVNYFQMNDVPELNAGTYILQLASPEQKIIQKIVKQSSL